MKRITSCFVLFAMIISLAVMPQTAPTARAASGGWTVSGAKSYETENGIGISFSEGAPVMTYQTDAALDGSVVLEFDLKAKGAKQHIVRAYSEEGSSFFYLDTVKNIWVTYDGWKQSSLSYQMGEFSENHFMYIFDVKNQKYSIYMDGNAIYENAGYIDKPQNFKTISFSFKNLFGDMTVAAEINNMTVYSKTKDEIDKERYGEAPEKKVDFFSDIKDFVINNKIFMIGSNTVLENFSTKAFDSAVYEEDGVCYIPKTMLDEDAKTNAYVTAESVGAVRNGSFLAIGTNTDGFMKLPDNLRTKRIFGIFVSPDGDDENDGTAEEPLKTVFAAKDMVKTVREEQGIPNGGIQVLFRNGEYSVDSSVVFNRSDSGTKKAPITYRSYPGEEAKILGSVALPSDKFKKIENQEAIERLQPGVAEHVWELDLKEIGLEKWGSTEAMGAPNGEGISSTAISVDGEMQTVAQWPNGSYTLITGADGSEMRISNERTREWKQPQYAYLYGWSIGWYQGSARFVVNQETGGLIMQTGLEHGGLGKGKRAQVINILEELDSEGEWYVDNDTSILYIWLPKEPTDSHITMSMLKDNFMNLYGTEYVTFERLYFGETRGNGFYGNELRDVNFLGCQFKQIGIRAMKIENSYDCDILSCDIEECGKGGIVLGGGDKETLTPGNNTIKNCHMREFSTQNKTSAYGILLRGVGNVASNNQLNDIQHQAVGFSGNFNEVTYNEIYNVMNEADDAGAIYTGKSFVDQGNRVNYNFIHDIEKGTGTDDRMAIYMDDQMCGTEIKGNLIVDCSVAMLLHGGREHTVEGNLSINCVKGIHAIDWFYKTQMDAPDFVMWTTLDSSPYKTELWQKLFPRLMNVREDQPAEPKYNTIRNNLDINSEIAGTVASNNYKDYGTYENNVDSKDLSYVYDVENYDFKVNVNSETFKNNSDMPVIPYEKMGMYYDKYRTKMPKLGDFEQLYPENNETDIEAKSVTFSWEAADNVSEYEFVLARDKDFTDIVHSETKRGLPSVTIENLEYNRTDYYWKVTAKMNTKLQRDEKIAINGPFKLTTAQDEELNTLNLERMIEKADEMYKNSTEGTNVGNFEVGSRTELYKEISAAKKLLKNKNLKQPQVVEEEAVLKAAINLFSSKGVRGDFYLDEEHLNGSQWTLGTERQADGSYKLVNGQNASKFKVSQFETVHMKVKLDIKPSDWQGITVRNTYNDKPFYSGNQNYGIVVKEDIIEFQQYAKFNDDKRSGVVTTIDNTFMKNGEWYDLTIKTDNTAEGVKITVLVNDEVMFDMLDDRDFSVLQDGYLNMQVSGMYFMPVSAE